MDKDALAKYREQLGMTQTQLAATLGVTQTTVSRWESGAKPIGNAIILEYALRYLLGRKRAEIDRALEIEREQGRDRPS